jgi:hypothetical protein
MNDNIDLKALHPLRTRFDVVQSVVLGLGPWKARPEAKEKLNPVHPRYLFGELDQARSKSFLLTDSR